MVFIKKTYKEDQNFNIGLSLNHKTIVKGTVGLEIEIEGSKLPKPPGMEGSHAPVLLPGVEGWSYVHDGSLRGEDNAEYVLSKPIEFNEVSSRINELWAEFEKKKSTIDDSNRTSVHVHLNVQPFYLNRLTALMALSFCFEEVLTEWCGDHRVGNLFCLRAKDAPAIVSQIKRFIRRNMEAPLHENHHYAGVNAHAVCKQGSLEFRHLRGVSDPEIIKQWVEILRRFYDLSSEFFDPREICSDFSAGGPLAFFDSILGDKAGIVRDGINMTEDDIRDSMYTGIRLAQDICYSKDWSLFRPIEFKPDPFGRDPRTLLKKMRSNESEDTKIENLMAELNDHTEIWADEEDAPAPEEPLHVPGFTPVSIHIPSHWANPSD